MKIQSSTSKGGNRFTPRIGNNRRPFNKAKAKRIKAIAQASRRVNRGQ